MTSGGTFWTSPDGPAKTRGNYAASKMASTVFGIELAKRLGDAAIVVEADPGFVASDIWRNDPMMVRVVHVHALATLAPYDEGVRCDDRTLGRQTENPDSCVRPVPSTRLAAAPRAAPHLLARLRRGLPL
jgi:NAD(P)-dependent dehydrogenase (short-subunit alcohol dehydrogenase family)